MSYRPRLPVEAMARIRPSGISWEGGLTDSARRVPGRLILAMRVIRRVAHCRAVGCGINGASRTIPLSAMGDARIDFTLSDRERHEHFDRLMDAAAEAYRCVQTERRQCHVAECVPVVAGTAITTTNTESAT